MSTIKEGDRVGISYIGKLDNGEVFKTIEAENPLFIKLGNSDAPPTLEIALEGMKVGETKSIRVPPEESYGPREKNLLQELKLHSFPKGISPKPGMTLALKVNKDGVDHQVPATVISVENDTVTVDYNHPLAGHHLTYNITIVSIEK